MIFRRISTTTTFLIGFISVWLILGSYLYTTVEAGCPNILNNGWPANGGSNSYFFPNHIKYNIASDFSQLEADQLTSALSRWTHHNTNVNCSNVMFSPDNFALSKFWISANPGQFSPQKPGSSAATSYD